MIAHEEFSVFGERPHLAEPEVSIEHLNEPRAVVMQTDVERNNAETRATAGFRFPWGGDTPEFGRSRSQAVGAHARVHAHDRAADHARVASG